MAKYKNGINGPISGKVGMVIGSSCRGVQYLKSVADISTVPATEAQLNIGLCGSSEGMGESYWIIACYK